MNLNEFIAAFAAEFDETDEGLFMATTKFKSLPEWSSLTALSIIAMIDDQMEKTVTGADIRASETIEDLYNLVQKK